jgi:ankyrin repeat protein
MIAAERGHAEIVASLLATGADPAARDLEGRSALDLASEAAVRKALGGG